MSRTTKSACLPGSRLPISFSFFKAIAAFRVMPRIASAGVIRICVQAIVVIRGRDGVMQEPGLKSEAKATVTPLAIIFRAGA